MPHFLPSPSRSLLGALAIAALAGAAGCASVPPPREEIAVSRAAVEQARTAGAAQSASTELLSAQQKLDRAESAMRNERYVDARRLAQEAEVDARLATAKANSTKSQAAVAEVQNGIRVLQEEINRTAPRQ